MDRYDRERLKKDIIDELQEWYLKIMYRWYPGCMVGHTKGRDPLDVYKVRKPRFEVKMFYPGNYTPYYFCPNPELTIYDKKHDWGYTRCLSKSNAETCINPELYFARIADEIYKIFEEDDQKRIKRLLNHQYGLFGSSEIGIGRYTAEIFAQELDRINKNKRSYCGDSVDAYTYAIEVLGQKKLAEYNISELYSKYMFSQNNLFLDGMSTREEIYRQTKKHFERLKQNVLESWGVPATVVMPRNVGYSSVQRQMELYRQLLFENDSIINKFKEDLNNMGRRNYRMPKQCAVIFDNGENLLLDVETVEREEMCFSIQPKFKLEGRYKYPATAAESDLPMKVLGEWRSALRPELSYEKVIFNDPATIVIWKDGTKTIVKVQPGETYDAEKGLALCFMKKALGNKGNFNNILKKELAQLKTKQPEISIGLNVVDGLTEGIKKAGAAIKEASDKLYGCRKGSSTEGYHKETEAANEQNEDS